MLHSSEEKQNTIENLSSRGNKLQYVHNYDMTPFHGGPFLKLTMLHTSHLA